MSDLYHAFINSIDKDFASFSKIEPPPKITRNHADNLTMAKVLTPIVKLLLALVATATLFSVFPRPGLGTDPSEHEAMPCGQCHSLVGSLESPAFPAAAINNECRRCHPDIGENVESSLGFHREGDNNCTRCHSFHDLKILTAGSRDFTFDFDDPQKTYQCQACHISGQSLDRISPGHRQATFIYHNDESIMELLSPSDKCLACHSPQSIVPEARNLDTQAPRLNRHASHPFGVPASAGKTASFGRIRNSTDPRIPLNDGRIECQSCHSLLAQNNDLLVELSDLNGPCGGCHQFN